MNTIQSPFKFLDAYTLKDRAIFFGRDEEINQLYKLIFETNMVLVYGPSGSGKTSLVQCGLASRFKQTDWFHLNIRQKGDINASFRKELRRYAKTPFTDEMTIVEQVESLFLDFFKPIYLIFDQFEELYIIGSAEERAIFIQDIAAIIEADINCKVLIIMREEYIARLYDFEKQVPQLFDKRLRVEPMSYANVEKVIIGSTARFNIKIEQPELTIPKIIDSVSDGRSGVQLSYLQVYLDKLYRVAYQNTWNR